LLVINNAHAQPVHEPDAPDDVDRKVFVCGKVNHCLPFKSAHRHRDFVTVSRERTRRRADTLRFAAFYIHTEQFGIAALEDAERAARVELHPDDNLIANV
jgi:hypothetical protein